MFEILREVRRITPSPQPSPTRGEGVLGGGERMLEILREVRRIACPIWSVGVGTVRPAGQTRMPGAVSGSSLARAAEPGLDIDIRSSTDRTASQ